MDSRGFALVELLVGVAIIAIVMVVVGFQFFGWQAKYKVESEIKELAATLMDARIRARQKNVEHFIVFDKTSDNKPVDEARRECIVYEDDDEDGNLDTGVDKEVRDLTKKGLPYRLNWNDTGGRNNVGSKIVFVIDDKGFVSMRKLSGEDLMFPDPYPATAATDGMAAFMKLWLVDPGDKRYIAADIPDPGDRPDVSYDCITVSETRINIGKLSDDGGDCDEK